MCPRTCSTRSLITHHQPILLPPPSARIRLDSATHALSTLRCKVLKARNHAEYILLDETQGELDGSLAAYDAIIDLWGDLLGCFDTAGTEEEVQQQLEVWASPHTDRFEFEVRSSQQNIDAMRVEIRRCESLSEAMATYRKMCVYYYVASISLNISASLCLHASSHPLNTC